MVKRAAQRTAGINMDGFKPQQAVIDGQSPPVGPAAGPAPTASSPSAGYIRRYTGVGTVMAAITGESRLAHELDGVKSALENSMKKLADWEEKVFVESLDAALVQRSRWSNRDPAEFATTEFARLKDEISQAGGNVQPIKVRQLPGVIDGQSVRYELVYGHRRHQACLELGMSVNAIVAQDMDDLQLFQEMDRENRARKNLSAWEQGKMYENAIRGGLFPSMRQLSAALGVNLSDALRSAQLAKLPVEVVDAFPSPLELQVRWAKPLADALQKDPEGTIAAAHELATKRGSLTSAEVLARLVGPTATHAKALPILVAGQERARLRSGPKQALTIEIDAGIVPKEKQRDLVKLLASFLASCLPASKG